MSDASASDAPSDAPMQRAIAAVRAQTRATPQVALILGSGLGDLADDAENATTIPATDVPGYPPSTVSGHHGRLVVGTLEGVDVVFVQGRVHYYEGYPLHRVTFPVRLVHALGAERLLVTNSAGGINRTFEPGTLMFITDHINGVFNSPLVGRAAPPRVEPHGAQAPYYDPDWTARAQAVARAQGLPTRAGTYIWTKGPSYETKAEIRAFTQMGADAVGMSTVPEVIQARQLGMSVLGLSTITNPAAGLGAEPLDHDDVLAVGQRVRAHLAQLVRGILRETI
ncbi:MAG: purine-nucleoside phosphorylase [Bacteroidetes bacterium]|jgi:purine-nucleoside phosphorylase|nr:purine-nucleoside phosphorylase [Bacteroidota bacterium]